MNGQQRVIIENVKPQINCGEFPVKRVVNDKVEVEADIFCDSHDVLNAEILYRCQNEKEWHLSEMEHDVNDRWSGCFKVPELGNCFFTVKGWADHFKTWHRDILKKIHAATDYASDLLAGAEIIRQTMSKYQDELLPEEAEFLKEALEDLTAENKPASERTTIILNNALFHIMVRYPLKNHATIYNKELEVTVERERANFSSWYEVFPRSLGKGTEQHGTFKDVIDFLPYVAEMGFDVLYLPPIHPIGKTKRKGRNNSTEAQKGDPGSPWAIGSADGGHKAIHPELGSLDDFRNLISEAAEHGIEIAMDVAFQCSPDHPYVKDHPEWFKHRPDGSLQYAENPPKKYEDIYPLNFESDDWENLWEELKSVFEYWIDKGVKIFRVDNPHTKSFRFWAWTIGELKKSHPETIFLAEAFTRPKVKYQLAKGGFTQSYTYFTWRNTKYDITTYCNELTKTEVRDFFRPNFWPNTPDILPEYLQVSQRVGFIQRLVLAATLSSNYGIYGPAFELMENTPTVPGKEEYLNSEKYELKDWDINHPGSLKKVITRINKIRRENKALQNTHSLKFHDINNEALLCYSKTSDDLSSIILVVVNLDPHYTHHGWIHLPVKDFDMDKHTSYQVHDLLSGAFYLWNGEHNYVEIDPGIMPVHIFKVRKRVRTEQDFDYFM
ncbi:alpha-1,4-glucan--maltose-1-phosphate maltosyltransferase [Marinilabilia rubra]|uniref:Alpha-1,4-glucan:maltose-1-phosphate maltosyltransferase n=1 Tax=Marinilabilia rubra TaxID=2162893 RepID=A0A2U2B7W6_9BACT|nr:alpha-1,4-glucan--maltose-1-phosphate maltosyltransferase [Marinilabilia rubra]PWD99142.1 alpha-1,4-glucan--maltose-1-phosphate maltosyltransferase [Marinilabilia rubra]